MAPIVTGGLLGPAGLLVTGGLGPSDTPPPDPTPIPTVFRSTIERDGPDPYMARVTPGRPAIATLGD